MLRWCSYCQRFQGESPPYDVLAISHGICQACVNEDSDLLDRDLAHAHALRAIQARLMDTGRLGNLNAADQIVRAAVDSGVRSIDVLMGIMAPTLYQIGEDWKRAAITVADEHRFTAFCEGVIELVAARVRTAAPAGAANSEREVLLMNASGNRHTLAIRMLALWLVDAGVPARVLGQTPGIEELVALVSATQPTRLLISMALSEQVRSVAQIAERMAELPAAIRPRIVVGGYAVKLGLVEPIPGADLVADVSAL